MTAIRGDIPLSFRPHIPGMVEVMPNQTSVTQEKQIWLPLLPQRGLIARDPTRRGKIKSLGLMANRFNVPASLLDPSFEERLAAIGVSWQPTLKDRRMSTAPKWHDFEQLDAILCTRSDPLTEGALRKPATKLINAWVAGAIPLINAEPGYLEIARLGVDAILIDAPDRVVEILTRLTSDPRMLQRLEDGVAERAVEFRKTKILQQWADFVTQARSPRRPSDTAPLIG